MDRDHSRIVIVLLAGILFVLLFGREAATALLGSAFWVLLIIGAVILITSAIVVATRGIRREAKAYREEVGRDRAEGRPWLRTFILWPGVIGNFAVVAFAAFHYFFANDCTRFSGCLDRIPFWWVPVVLLLLSLPIQWAETLFSKERITHKKKR